MSGGRKVAERLRATKDECEKRGYPWMVEDLLQALGFETYEDGEDGIFDRLADLIDPTCEVDGVTAPDAIDPGHYRQGDVETIQLIEDVLDELDGQPLWRLWAIGNAIKYLSRAPYKGQYKDDVKKAANYLHRAIDHKWIAETEEDA